MTRLIAAAAIIGALVFNNLNAQVTTQPSEKGTKSKAPVEKMEQKTAPVKVKEAPKEEVKEKAVKETPVTKPKVKSVVQPKVKAVKEPKMEGTKTAEKGKVHAKGTKLAKHKAKHHTKKVKEVKTTKH